jgi:hypothetical protein
MTNTPPPLAEPEDDDHQSLADSDASLARVTEDLIDILLTRGLIQFTDFPPAAQAKLLQRRQTRAILSKRLKLLDDGDGLI